jgi:muramidase (phage lysozyme)
MRYGGAAGTQYFDSFVDHPRILVLIPNDPEGRKSSAAGAPQITASTYDYLRSIYTGINDYTPRTQDGLYVGCLIKTGALELVQAGRFDEAVAASRDEWTSLPGAAENNARWTLAKARELYQEYGGTMSPRDTVPIDAVAKPKPRSIGMGALALFAPILAQLIPQIASILKPESDVAKRNVALGETIANTIVQAAGATNLQDAVEKMQADPAVKDVVQKAVVTEPAIMATLQITEIGGGIAGAREADLVASQSDKPFWKTSAVFWVSMLLLPMVYWYVGSSVVGGIEVPPEWPWYAQLPLKLFGLGWSLDARSGLANLVVGLVLGGIVGVYFGVSVTQQKQQGNAVPPKEA